MSPSLPIPTPESMGLEPLDLTGIRDFKPSMSLWHAKTREFYDYWCSLAQDAKPLFDTLDLLDIGDKLEGLIVAKMGTTPKDSEMIFVGPEFANLLGEDYTGVALSDLPDQPFFQRGIYIFHRVAATGAPVLNQTPQVFIIEKNFLSLESLSLPLYDSQGQISHIMGSTIIDVTPELRPLTKCA